MKKIFIALIIALIISAGLLAGYFLRFLRHDYGQAENAGEAVETRAAIAQKENTEEEPRNFHYSYFNQRDFYDKAFAKVGQLGEHKNIRSLVINHHLLADDLIAEAFSVVANTEQRTVILMSPNHFAAGRGQIISSLYDWQTPYGILEADKELIGQLQKYELVSVEEKPFAEEHGIRNLAAFIKKTLPKAKIAPLLFRDAIPAESSYIFAQNLKTLLPADSLVIASVDFSHTLPPLAAEFHDQKSLAVLSDLDYNGVDFLDIDSKPTLRVLLKYLELAGAQEFHLLRNSNASIILGDPELVDTTSYITGVFTQGGKIANNQAAILGLGDMMLDRGVRNAINKNSKKYPFEHIEHWLGGSDIVLANLEGSFTDFLTKYPQPNNFSFTFAPELAPVLNKLGFDIFSLANNHALNFGQEGLRQGKAYLADAGIEYFGDPLNREPVSYIKKVRGTKIGFVGYHEFAYANWEKILAEITRLKTEVDFVIVMPHWGNEYQKMFSKSQQKKAHQFIDAGADLVLGAHPHVIQPLEIYNNKLIFYSLGNFLFDQTFSEETMQALGVGIVVNDQEAIYYLFPLETKDFQIHLLAGEKRDIILSEMADGSVASNEAKEQIKKSKIIIKR